MEYFTPPEEGRDDYLTFEDDDSFDVLPDVPGLISQDHQEADTEVFEITPEDFNGLLDN